MPDNSGQVSVPTSSAEGTTRRRVGLVLAGGAARGAYEVGVVQHILEEVSKDLGRDVPLDVLCGTSIGALNVCALAAFADTPRDRARRMAEHWTSLRVTDVIRPDAREIFSMMRGFFGRGAGSSLSADRRGGIFDPLGMQQLVARFIPFHHIDDNLRAGHLHGISVSTTHVGTGRTVVWVQRADLELPPWYGDPTVIPRAVQLRARHALASAAIPFLFPAVRIDGDYYCDGGLRQNVPLSPARRLGAEGLVIVNPRYLPPPEQVKFSEGGGLPGPLELLGKTLNALLLDRLDNDIDRLRGINEILDAGCNLYGTDFLDQLNGELGRPPGRGLRPVEVVLIRTSEDIGRLAAQYIASPAFTARNSGVVSAVLRRLAEDESRQADFISYLLFDGEFARQLIELGHANARAKHEELCRFFQGYLS